MDHWFDISLNAWGAAYAMISIFIPVMIFILVTRVLARSAVKTKRAIFRK